MSEPNLQQRILDVFRKFGDPCTRAEAFTTNTLTLSADQARELAVITLSHPRPLSERMRKTVIELVRIAA